MKSNGLKKNAYSFRWFWQMVHLPHEGELRNSTPTRLSIIQLKKDIKLLLIEIYTICYIVLYILTNLYNNMINYYLIFICFPGIRMDAASNSSKVCNWTFEVCGPHLVWLFWLKWQVSGGADEVVIVPSGFILIMIALVLNGISKYILNL